MILAACTPQLSSLSRTLNFGWFRTEKCLIDPKPALGGARPEAFGICEAPILNNAYAYPNYYLFLVGCFINILKPIAMKDEHQK